MVQKKSGNPFNGTLVAAFLILIAAFLSSVINQPVEEVNSVLSGQVITTVTGYATQNNFGTITSCTVDRNIKGSNAVCTPPSGPVNTKKVGTYEEFNGWGQWYNAYSIYISDNVAASLIKCQMPCDLAACPTGTTLQATLYEGKFSSQPSADTISNDWKYGLCANVNITARSCIQSTKGRSCSTSSPGTEYLKLSGYITDIVNYIGSTRYFRYYDFYIQQVEPTTTTTLPSHCSDNTWSGDEADLDCGGSCNKCSDTLSCWDNSDCSSSNCYFDSATLSRRNTAGIQPGQRLTPSSGNIQYQGVCQAAGGSCTGSDCGQAACRASKDACNSNSNCAWNEFETDPNQPKCKSVQAICNSFGVKLCNFKDFLAGDYSCLRKNQQGYYTEACVGSGNVGFWNTIEVY